MALGIGTKSAITAQGILLVFCSAVLAALPSSIDNSVLPFFPPVGNQGTLNSCAAFAGTYYTATYMTALVRGYDVHSGDQSRIFSPKWTYNSLTKGDDYGNLSASDVFALLKLHGAATWQEFPYNNNYREWCLNPAVWRNTLFRRCEASGALYGAEKDSGMAEVKAALSKGYIMSIAVWINSWHWKTVQNDPATSADDPWVGEYVCDWVDSLRNGGHEMTVVGYNDDLWTDINGNGTVDSGEKGAFKVANQYGAGWQNSGFAWMAYDALKSVSSVTGVPPQGRIPGWGNGAFHDAKWITAYVDYQPRVIARIILNHAKRNQFMVRFGIGSTTDTYPVYRINNPKMLNELPKNYTSPALSFNGTTTAVDGVFYLDLSDLVQYIPTLTTDSTRWFLTAQDGYATDSLLIKHFSLIDLTKPDSLGYDTLVTVSMNSASLWLDYKYTGGGFIPRVADPFIYPPGGDYSDSVLVRVLNGTNNALVHYTLDGSDPTESSPELTDHALTLTQTTTLKAVAYRDSSLPSDIVSATFAFPAAGLAFTAGAPGARAVLSVYPNPLSRGEVLTVRFPGRQQKYMVGLYDIRGRQIFVSYFTREQLYQGAVIPADRIPAGVYFLRAGHGDEWCSRRILRR